MRSVIAITMFLGGEICSMSEIRKERVEEKISKVEQSKTKKTEKHVRFEVCFFFNLKISYCIYCKAVLHNFYDFIHANLLLLGVFKSYFGA